MGTKPCEGLYKLPCMIKWFGNGELHQLPVCGPSPARVLSARHVSSSFLSLIDLLLVIKLAWADLRARSCFRTAASTDSLLMSPGVNDLHSSRGSAMMPGPTHPMQSGPAVIKAHHVDLPASRNRRISKVTKDQIIRTYTPINPYTQTSDGAGPAGKRSLY